ncbi:MAG TPA: hypothetical protein VE631_11335 [Alphaproteobacteria bacterium]|nr:hypothetical protein [Alphaproteobacteria bacterium]
MQAAGDAPKPGSKPASAQGRAQAPECSWVGERVVTALLRDDVIAADGFQRFYRTFGCPVDHLGRAFGCAVPFAGADAAGIDARVHACWRNPAPEGARAQTAPIEVTPPPDGKPQKAAPEAGPAGKENKTQSPSTYPKK